MEVYSHVERSTRMSLRCAKPARVRACVWGSCWWKRVTMQGQQRGHVSPKLCFSQSADVFNVTGGKKCINHVLQQQTMFLSVKTGQAYSDVSTRCLSFFLSSCVFSLLLPAHRQPTISGPEQSVEWVQLREAQRERGTFTSMAMYNGFVYISVYVTSALHC